MRIAAESPLILGSASPRRREILESLRIPFAVVSADADETVRERESPDAYLDRIVHAKLEAVRAVVPAALGRAAAVLVADTSVIVDASILGKPSSVEEGLCMIERLAGRTHEVHTRFLVASPRAGGPLPGGLGPHAETVVTRVTFRALSAAEAGAYASSGEGRDKAGGYAVQGLGAAFVSRIDGSYTNVVGLPACEVVVALQRLGLR
jgi:septum formation protein